MENKRILVIGGTGFIGMSLVQKLINSNYNVTLLVKKDIFSKNIPSNRALAPTTCKYFFGDLLDKDSLMKNINNFDLIINLAAIIRTLNKKRYKENIQSIKNLIEVLDEKKIKKLIYFSTQSVNLKEKGPYSKSKEVAEKMVRDSNLDYLIIRPNYVYGIDKFNDFYRLAYFIYHFHLAPIIGNGNYKIQPTFKDDLVNIVFKFIGNFKNKSIIEISGKETTSINEIVETIKENLKIKPIIFHIPVTLLRLFRNFIPFDIDGYTEDRISQNPYSDYNFSLFSDNLKKILKLLK